MTDGGDHTRAIADQLCATRLGHPVRVAVDGITASGKTTIAAAVASAVNAIGRPVIHLTMDGFHHPRVHRHRQGRMSADGYYEDAYDFDALIRHVLRPLGPDGSGRYRRSIIDLASDTPTAPDTVLAPSNAVLVVDGTFLHRPPLTEHWDRTVFVDTDFDTARARGIERDADLLGGPDKAADAFDLRYHAASRRYLREVHPWLSATFVVDNRE
nr:hypothetical protein [Rhodococcus sp. (in: high G+C Gram-positive bacteria)]